MRAMATLVLVFVAVGNCAPEGRKLKPGEINSAETCGTCHEQIYQQWKSSYHSKAATDPVYLKLFEVALKSKSARASNYCLTCHAPVATLTGSAPYYVDRDAPPELTPVAREGVTCDFCHTISGSKQIAANVSSGIYSILHEGDTITKWGSHSDASTPAHPTAVSVFLRDSRFCSICHRLTHPLPGIILQNTYLEWAYSPYKDEGRQCQDCHMPEYSGTSARSGPVRSDLNAHVFPGGHSEMIQRAATVTLAAEVRRSSNKPRIKLKTAVTNSGSGHLMPTGIPGIRELWLEIAVRDASQTTVFQRTIRFEATLVDEFGRRAMPWEAIRVAEDTRLPPRKSRKSTFVFSPSAAEPGPLDVEASLFYRLISTEIAKLAGIDLPKPSKVAGDRIRIRADGSVSHLED